MFLLHFLVDLIALTSEVLCLLDHAVILCILVLLDSEFCCDLFLFLGEQVFGVRFRIQLCLETTRNQLGRDQPYSLMFLVVVSR